MRDEVGRAFRFAGVDDEAARDVIQRAHHCDFFGLPWRRHTQIGSTPGPCTGQIGMGERFAFVAIR